MTQQIINWDEEMVGANHPTKPDTLNRGFLVEHNADGTHSDAVKPMTVDNATSSLSGGTATVWTDVDLSTYVPAGAKWALLDVEIQKSATDYIVLQVKKKGNTNAGAMVGVKGYSDSRVRGQVWCEVDGNRYIQYKGTSGASANIAIVGYM